MNWEQSVTNENGDLLAHAKIMSSLSSFLSVTVCTCG